MSGWDVLERHFEGLTADEVDAELAAVPVPGASPATAAATTYLVAHGGPDLDGDPTSAGDLRQRRVLAAAKTMSEIVGSALTLDHVAETLGLSRSRISHRLAEQTLWAFTAHGHRYVPRWQITTDVPRDRSRFGVGTLPGLPQVVPAIPKNLHPLAVETFMTAARDEFEGRSPVEWLVSGGDPEAIVEWLAGMAHG